MTEKKHLERTMLYKERACGTKNEHAWNLPLDTKIVEDGEVGAHQAEGWLTAAEVHAPKVETKSNLKTKPADSGDATKAKADA